MLRLLGDKLEVQVGILLAHEERWWAFGAGVTKLLPLVFQKKFTPQLFIKYAKAMACKPKPLVCHSLV